MDQISVDYFGLLLIVID